MLQSDGARQGELRRPSSRDEKRIPAHQFAERAGVAVASMRVPLPRRSLSDLKGADFGANRVFWGVSGGSGHRAVARAYRVWKKFEATATTPLGSPSRRVLPSERMVLPWRA